MLALREDRHQMGGGLGIETRHQPALFVLQQRLQDRLDLRGRLPLAEDDLRKAAADTPVQIHLGEPSRILVRLDFEFARPRRRVRFGRLEQRRAALSSSCESITSLRSRGACLCSV